MRNIEALQETVERSKAGHLTAHEAAALAVRHGAKLIGTAQSKDGYTPSILLSSQYRDEAGNPHWKVWHANERGGATPAIYAGSVAETAVWGAFGGDANHPLQRLSIGRSFLSHPERYDFGTHGWRFDPDANSYVLRGHVDLLEQARTIDDDAIVGKIDLIDASGADVYDLPGEPGHSFVFSDLEVIGSLVVRMGDVRQIDTIESYYYAPLLA